LNEEQRRAADAQSLLGNPVFKGAMEAMEAKLHANIAAGNPDNKEQCSRLVHAVQILKGIQREIERYITDGEVADLIELQADKRLTPKERVTGVMVR
jgi:hypothetical protein